MVRLWFLLGIGLVSLSSQAATMEDTTQAQARYDALAKQIGLKPPKLRAGEYQVRVWTSVELAYGDAQTLYVLDRTRRGFFVSGYSLSWADKRRLKRVSRIRRFEKADPERWQQLLADGLLTLPDQAALDNQLYPKPPLPDERTVTVTADSGVVVKAPRIENTIMIMDGTAYRFDLFMHNARRTYRYHCPQSYGSVRTKVVELKKAVSLLKHVFSLFGDQSHICIRQPFKRIPAS